MNTTPNDEIRALDQLEVALRNMLPVLERVRPILRRYDRPEFAEVVGPMLQWLTRCAPNGLVESVVAFRAAIESERG